MLRIAEPASGSRLVGVAGAVDALPSAVTVGLVDGSTHVGTIATFSPQQVDVRLVDARGRQQLLAAERITYLAYHRRPKRSVTVPEGAEVHKIHLLGRQVFRVLATLSAGSSGGRELGFTATPADADSAFDEFFFYHHGVVAKERDEPIGEMLVREGAFARAALEQALAAQSAQRSVPSARSSSNIARSHRTTSRGRRSSNSGANCALGRYSLKRGWCPRRTSRRHSSSKGCARGSALARCWSSSAF